MRDEWDKLHGARGRLLASEKLGNDGKFGEREAVLRYALIVIFHNLW